VPVSDDVAYRLAVELTLIPECPQSQTAIEKLARDMIRLCSDDAEAEQIVREASDRWDRWRGTRGLIELLESKRPNPPPSNQAIDYGPRPKPDCAICADFGHFSSPDGKVSWCDCPVGRETRERMPDLAELLTRKQIRPLHQAPAAPVRKPITQEDLDRAFSERQDRTEELIADARAALADPEASRDRKEIAREILRRFAL
jgi:hypothetical protein